MTGVSISRAIHEQYRFSEALNKAAEGMGKLLLVGVNLIFTATEFYKLYFYLLHRYIDVINDNCIYFSVSAKDK